MPPKNTNAGTLYLSSDGGETYKPFGEVIVDDLMPKPGMEAALMELPEKYEMAFTVRLSTRFSIFEPVGRALWLGETPSNNWLRLHGYPMRRRRHDHKQRK